MEPDVRQFEPDKTRQMIAVADIGWVERTPHAPHKNEDTSS
jgi:hypothetical protein